MNLIPDRFSKRDIILAVAGLVLVAGAFAAYFAMSDSSPMSQGSGVPAEPVQEAAATPEATPAAPRKLDVQESVPAHGGGPRANPGYK